MIIAFELYVHGQTDRQRLTIPFRRIGRLKEFEVLLNVKIGVLISFSKNLFTF